MKVLIVAKTRRGGGACVGGITTEGRSVRLVAADAAPNERAGLEYQVGDVWEVDSAPDEHIVPPHVENIIVSRARFLRSSTELEKAIVRFMPPVSGGPEKLFDGRLQASPSGALYIAQQTGLPSRSTMFWKPDQPLTLDFEGKRIRYRYPTADGGRSITFVGFQEPVETIAEGTLLRVSLAHWWRPTDSAEEELRCYVQLSGWFPYQRLASSRTSVTASVNRAQPDPPSMQQATRTEPTWLPPPVAPDLNRAREVLKRAFGFAEFLPAQGDVLAHVLRGHDTLAVMPTGGGKSLCYQLPALLLDGLTVVVSPLIALMQDQVSQLHRLGIPSAFLNSTVQLHDYISTTNRVRHGEIKLLYTAPETLLRPETLLLLEQSRLKCLAVDEAHCISEWGHDFRPEYRQLQAVRARFPQAVCLALTATATERVRQDIRRLLGIAADGEFVASFNRRNLFLAAEPRLNGLTQTIAFLEQHRGQAGIIYCGTRRQVDEVTSALNANGWPALPYHAGLEDKVRCKNQQRFIHDEVPLMVATIAFGLGINKPNVRFVVHYHLPKDLEGYYQEIGRAGRDGLPADCLLLYSRGDAMVHRHFIDEGAEAERPGRRARLNALVRYTEARDCRRVPLLAYFGETLTPPCGHCDNCVPRSESGDTTDVSEAARKLFSCIQRTGQVFGAAHLIAVLRGSRSKKVLTSRHDKLSTFGTGREYSVKVWQQLAQQFTRQGLLDVDAEYGSLRLTPKGWQVLKGETVRARLTSVHDAPPPPLAVPPAAVRRCDEIGQLFQAGHTLTQIARRYAVQRQTVIENLYRFHQAGGQLEAPRLLASSGLPEQDRRRVLQTFKRLGLEHLAVVREALSGTVSYEELHLLRLYALCQASAAVQPATSAAGSGNALRISPKR